jgi:hypothetical protein
MTPIHTFFELLGTISTTGPYCNTQKTPTKTGTGRSEGATRSLKLVDMNFANFVQKDVNGTVIYMESADEFEVQGGSFVKNTLETDPKPKETGGQVHIEEV